MNYLLDTCAYIFLLMQPDRFSESTRRILMDPANTLYVSAVSANEIAIKRSQNKLTLNCDDLAEVEARGLTHLPVTYQHGKQVGELPYYHKDPFDRLIIAQAYCEQLTVITCDSQFDKYPVFIEPV